MQWHLHCNKHYSPLGCIEWSKWCTLTGINPSPKHVCTHWGVTEKGASGPREQAVSLGSPRGKRGGRMWVVCRCDNGSQRTCCGYSQSTPRESLHLRMVDYPCLPQPCTSGISRVKVAGCWFPLVQGQVIPCSPDLLTSGCRYPDPNVPAALFSISSQGPSKSHTESRESLWLWHWRLFNNLEERVLGVGAEPFHMA